MTGGKTNWCLQWRCVKLLDTFKAITAPNTFSRADGRLSSLAFRTCESLAWLWASHLQTHGRHGHWVSWVHGAQLGLFQVCHQSQRAHSIRRWLTGHARSLATVPHCPASQWSHGMAPVFLESASTFNILASTALQQLQSLSSVGCFISTSECLAPQNKIIDLQHLPTLQRSLDSQSGSRIEYDARCQVWSHYEALLPVLVPSLTESDVSLQLEVADRYMLQISLVPKQEA